MKAIIIGLGAILALLALLVTQYEDSGPALGGSTPGTPSTLATSSIKAIGPQVNIELFSSNNSCTSRVISAQTQPVMLAFGDDTGTGGISSTSLSQTIGHIQAGSSTVSYDSSIYGCGRWFGFAGVSTTISTLETQ